jgi:hypothetical protein
MLNNKVTTEANQAAPAISPDLLAELKKEDMQQAVVERFRGDVDMPAHRTAARHGVRTSAWRSADDEC